MWLKKTIRKIFNKVAHHTGTDIAYFVRGSFWLTANQVVASIAAFAVTVILANILPKDIYGQYRFVLSVLPILSLFTLSGMANALTRSVARGYSVDIIRIVKEKISWGLLGSLLSIVVAGYYFINGNNTLGYIFILCAPFIPFFETYFVYSFWYKGKENFKTPSLYDSISRVVQAVILIGAVLLTKNIFVLLCAFLAGKLITNIFFYLRTKKHESAFSEPINDDTDEVIEYGKHLSLVGVLGIVAGSIDKLFIWHFGGKEELAIYHIALTIPLALILFLNVISRVSFPKLSKHNWMQGESNTIVKKIGFLAFILIAIAAAYALLVPFVIPIIFTNYSASIMTAVIAAILIPLMPLNAVLVQIFRAAKRLREIIVVRGIYLITFAIIFIKLQQVPVIEKTVIALIAGEAIILILNFILVKRIHNTA